MTLARFISICMPTVRVGRVTHTRTWQEASGESSAAGSRDGNQAAKNKVKTTTAKRKVTGPHRPHGVCALEEPDKCGGCALDFETSQTFRLRRLLDFTDVHTCRCSGRARNMQSMCARPPARVKADFETSYTFRLCRLSDFADVTYTRAGAWEEPATCRVCAPDFETS